VRSLGIDTISTILAAGLIIGEVGGFAVLLAGFVAGQLF
jgi:hypothetical protein